MANAYNPAESSSRFYVPRTLASDFTNFLSNDIPGAVGDFKLIDDWYAQTVEGYEPSIIIIGG